MANTKLPRTHIIHDPDNPVFKEIVCDCGYHTCITLSNTYTYEYLTSVVESHWQSHFRSYSTGLRLQYKGVPDAFKPLPRR